MHGWNGWEWTLSGGLMMGLGMLLMWGIPIALIIALVAYFKDRDKTIKQPERAMDILEIAYARGEISREEFLQKRNDLLGEKRPK